MSTIHTKDRAKHTFSSQNSKSLTANRLNAITFDMLGYKDNNLLISYAKHSVSRIR